MLGAGLDWKTSLQELVAHRGEGAPVYDSVGSGPDHARSFVTDAIVAGVSRGTGTGRSKKEAEQVAARAAFEALRDGPPPGVAAQSRGQSPEESPASSAAG